MSLDLTQGSQFYLVVLTDRQGRRQPVRIVSEESRFIFVSAINSHSHHTGDVASLEPIELRKAFGTKARRRAKL